MVFRLHGTLGFDDLLGRLFLKSLVSLLDLALHQLLLILTAALLLAD